MLTSPYLQSLAAASFEGFAGFNAGDFGMVCRFSVRSGRSSASPWFSVNSDGGICRGESEVFELADVVGVSGRLLEKE